MFNIQDFGVGKEGYEVYPSFKRITRSLTDRFLSPNHRTNSGEESFLRGSISIATVSST